VRLGGALSGTPLRVQALKRFRAEMMVGLATFPVSNRGPELFQRCNVHMEIKLILILILDRDGHIMRQF